MNIYTIKCIDQLRLIPSGVSPIITPKNYFEIISGYYFSVSPAIWKTKSLLDITSRFKEHTYRCAECEPIQQYVKITYNNYCIFSDNDVKLIPHDHYLSLLFPILHVTQYGKWSYNSDIEKYYINSIMLEYNINLNTRGIA